jgi:hypothetical protein
LGKEVMVECVWVVGMMHLLHGSFVKRGKHWMISWKKPLLWCTTLHITLTQHNSFQTSSQKLLISYFLLQTTCTQNSLSITFQNVEFSKCMIWC